MATVKKDMLTVRFTTFGGYEATATDEAGKMIGTSALGQFRAEKTVVIEGAEETVYIPFHAIDHVIVTKDEADVDVTDRNCVVE